MKLGAGYEQERRRRKKSQEEQQINVTPNIFQHLQSFFEDKQFPQEFPQEFNTIILEDRKCSLKIWLLLLLLWLLFCHCKIGYRDPNRILPRLIPGTCQDPTRILLWWPVFLEEPFPGKTPAAHLSKKPTKKSVLAKIPPWKKLSSRILMRILKESKILV